jgi:Ca2+-binding RTX toxin-like protein
MRGSGGDDLINGVNGDNQSPDQLYGFAGNDQLHTFDGVRNDTMWGGAGSDICFGDATEAHLDCETI